VNGCRQSDLKEAAPLCQFVWKSKSSPRVLAANPCRSSTPAAKVFHFLIPPNASSPSPRRLCCCCFWPLFHLVYPFVSWLCVWVYGCACLYRKSKRKTRARAFHHRHNLNSNINNLKWFVFFIRLAMVKAHPPAGSFLPLPHPHPHPHPVAVFLFATFPPPPG